MNCTGCIWLGTSGADSVCCMRDHIKSSSGELNFPVTPNIGCNKKEILVENPQGQKIVLSGSAIFMPLPDSYE
jgi:hypothetical protein